ncbi:hypothetical protein C7401_10365 [Paraburkholderia unamae]|uniref:hypothetical protein n=1 Tax=Paraburkholderia unamae TaxID=219649 RepID=UPI000DC5C7C2|nr:hypothetical protein [Paraburkholderia unamae]RAR65759.1 hypothetical protein C7401_10365 [Paraburkholderia unamae]
MTVDSAPVRLLSQSAPRKRLVAPAALITWRLSATLLACAVLGCALGACSERDADARVALSTNAARELAQAQPGHAPSPPLANAINQEAQASPSIPPDGAALPADTVRSPARPSDDTGAQSAQSAQAAQNEPLAPPVIHTVD